MPQLDKVFKVARLFDTYGQLLTERQRSLVELHYLHDLSLGEIAESKGITRQAVHDHITRAEEALEGYETKLRVVEQDTAIGNGLRRASMLVGAVQEELTRAIGLLDEAASADGGSVCPEASDSGDAADIVSVLQSAATTTERLRALIVKLAIT